MEYNSFLKTAITRKTLSVPMRELMNLGLINGKVLDYGAGKGFDLNYFKLLGIDIHGYDKYNPEYKNEEILNRNYDVITCNYVFNVIPSLEEHKQVLEILKNISDNIYISVRSDSKAIKDSWIYKEEYLGYVTPKGSFQRFYNEEMVNTLFGEVEYIVNNNSFKLFKLNITKIVDKKLYI
ncbi:MAG: methyltransferase domain-containing protein [Peptostreptococcaceae bacterium]|nr:methyltransferase domain-containing protein [Peptostreptococcaceae bacterium]